MRKSRIFVCLIAAAAGRVPHWARTIRLCADCGAAAVSRMVLVRRCVVARGPRDATSRAPVEPNVSSACSAAAASACSTIRFRNWNSAPRSSWPRRATANADDRSYNLNERSNDIAIDQFFLRWRATENTSLLAGKSVFPLELCADAVGRGFASGRRQRANAVRVERLRSSQLSADISPAICRTATTRASARCRPPAAGTRASRRVAAILVSYLDFSSLQPIDPAGPGADQCAHRRSSASATTVCSMRNSSAAGMSGNWPLEARLDLVRNLGADDRSRWRAFQHGAGRPAPAAWMGVWSGGPAHPARRGDGRVQFRRLVVPQLGARHHAMGRLWVRCHVEHAPGGYFTSSVTSVSQYTDRMLLDLYARW